ncbi:transcriptional regulator LsrR, partial [Yersinia pestis]
GVAGGVEKADVIVAALRGRYVNALVTDEVTARAIINLL